MPSAISRRNIWPWALKNAKQVTDADSYDITVTLKGKESTTTYTGADALFENESYAYYKLSETPACYITAWYNLLSGKWEFGKVRATLNMFPGNVAAVLYFADTGVRRGTQCGLRGDMLQELRALLGEDSVVLK